MRAQRRRFVVEVKRGTSRASFISSDAAAEKFSSAEDALFGPKTKPDVAPDAGPDAIATATSEPQSIGRVLRDLHEPPPPQPLPESLPARRGRKPGSKNKPKPVLDTVPGSPVARNRRALRADAVAAPYASPGPTPVSGSAPWPIESAQQVSAAPAPSAGDMTSPSRRPRLRDRSRILKRYVLGTEPGPGQAGWVRRRRAKR